MRKYLLVARNTWEETLAYRLNFVMWRIRTNISLLAFYFLWLVIIPKGSSFFGYNQSTMLTYVLGTALISAIVLSTRTQAVGDEINQGNLSNYLIKPINYFLYWLFKDLGDKAMNIAFSIVELSILFIILNPPVFIQTNFNFLSAFLFATALSLVMYFFISILLGFVGFWSSEVWAPRFIFLVSIGFFSGVYFPLDILPQPIFQMFKLLPFSYLIYFPLKIYLGQLSYSLIFTGLGTMVFWIMILYLLVKFVWNRGLKIYTAQGR